MFKRPPLLATALAPVLALAACGPGTENRGLESIHQPVVERSDYVFDVNAGYGDRVAVDDPAGGALQLRSDVAGQVARYGLLLADEAPVTAEPIAPGTARIVVSRMRASVPGCPDFSRYRGTEFESNTNSNYGCAMNANLAAMVANPADLVRGEPGANVYDAAQGSKAIVIYRNATPSGGGGTVKADAGGGK
jgi:pilus assembly protein CpaD